MYEFCLRKTISPKCHWGHLSPSPHPSLCQWGQPIITLPPICFWANLPTFYLACFVANLPAFCFTCFGSNLPEFKFPSVLGANLPELYLPSLLGPTSQRSSCHLFWAQAPRTPIFHQFWGQTPSQLMHCTHCSEWKGDYATFQPERNSTHYMQHVISKHYSFAILMWKSKWMLAAMTHPLVHRQM